MHILCPHCQSPVELVRLRPEEEIHCESCGSSFRLEADATIPIDSQTSRKRFGRFEIVGVVGQGAFGTVYRAKDTSLDRLVAIKVPRAGNVGSSGEQDRFLREARSVAQLRHPYIVPVYEVGEYESLPYLVSEFIEGMNLADSLTGRRLSIAEAVELAITVSGAIDYAHSQGVVHRDLKPSNILLDESGMPHVADFGLAKRNAGEVTMTMDGQLLGTPAYMSPEQARGEAHRVDGRSDVYSLGVILYQLLTGELPFRGNTRMLLHQVLYDEPRPPRGLNDRIPRDLETICLKCLEKDPPTRYQTAKALADDLRRFQQGSPISARRAGRVERFARWCRRRPALAALSAALVVALIVGFAGIYSQWQRAERERKLALSREVAAKSSEQRAVDEAQRAELSEAAAKRHLLSARRNLYVAHANVAQHLWQEGQIISLRNLLARQAPAKGEEDLRGFEWRYLSRLANSAGRMTLRGHADDVMGVAVSPDGRTIATASIDSTINLYDASDGRLIAVLPLPGGGRLDGAVGLVLAVTTEGPRIAEIVPDGPASQEPRIHVGDRLVGLSRAGGDVEPIADLPGEEVSKRLRGAPATSLQIQLIPEGGGRPETFTLVRRRLENLEIAQPSQHGGPAIAYSDDGRLLAAAGESLVVWNAATSEVVRTVPLAAPASDLEFAPRGTLLAIASREAESVELVDPANDHPPRRLAATGVPISAIAFSPDGLRLAGGGLNGTLKRWDVKTGVEIPTPLVLDSGGTAPIAWSPQGDTIATGSMDGHVALWDSETGRRRDIIPAHGNQVVALAFSPDGASLASAGFDTTIRIWDVASRLERNVFMGHAASVQAVAFSPDGRSLVSGGADKRSIVWDVDGKAEWREDAASLEEVQAISFLPDGRVAAGGGILRIPEAGPGELRVIEAQTGRSEGALQAKPVSVYGVAVSPDGALLASVHVNVLAGQRSEVILWDATSGSALRSLIGGSQSFAAAAFSPDSSLIATASANQFDFLDPGEITLWDTGSGRVQAVLGSGESGYTAVTFLKSAGALLAGTTTGALEVWDVARRQRVKTIEVGATVVTWISASPDDALAAVCDVDPTKLADPGVVSIWELASGRRTQELRGHQASVFMAKFSPDGQQLATAGADRTVRLWDAATGEERVRLEGHSTWVMAVAFSPDGSRLASVSGHLAEGTAGELKLWDVERGTDLFTASGHVGLASAVEFERDGRRLLTGSQDGLVRRWSAQTGEIEATLIDSEPGAAIGHTGAIVSVAVSPDGATLATGGEDHAIRLWDLASGTVVQTLTGHDSPITGLAFSPDGATLASSAGGLLPEPAAGEVKLWDVASGTLRSTINRHPAGINAIDFSPDGRYLAAASGLKTSPIEPSALRIWDVASGEMVRRLRGPQYYITTVRWNPKGQTLATGAFDRQICLWDAANGELLRQTVAHSEGITGLAYSPDGRTLASVARDGDVKLWQAAALEELLTLRSDADELNAVAFSKDGRILAAGGSRGQRGIVRFWDAPDVGR